MKFSYQWLQTFFDTPLPAPAVLEEKLTFHSSEVEEVVRVGEDTVFDVKVLPDKSAWLLSHRGLARELSVILDIPLTRDELATPATQLKTINDIDIVLNSPVCDFYGAAIIEGVSVGPSPAWLKERLEAIGQRSINNIVDATNYVMFELGQPLHAFDATTFATREDGVRMVCVRAAVDGEKMTTLSQEELTLTTEDVVITDGVRKEVLALAGVKGGLHSGVTDSTTTILLEAAHFDRFATRMAAQRHKLPTDAAKRYENGLSASVAPYGLVAGARLIAEIAGGSVKGVVSNGTSDIVRSSVSVSTSEVCRVLGVDISTGDIINIWRRFGYKVEEKEGVFTVIPPHERDDLTIAQDLIEEVGRIYGLSHIVSIPPQRAVVTEINVRHYYAEKIRAILTRRGFSEIYTSSFRDKDIARIKNALASDKSYLRSVLKDNVLEARERNIPYRDLLGLPAIKLFEIGTVFEVAQEAFHVGIAVQTGTAYKDKTDTPLLDEALTALESELGVTIEKLSTAPGYVEFSLEALLAALPVPLAYDVSVATESSLYKPFSLYPSVSRDIAMWVGEGEVATDVAAALRAAAGPLLVRLTHLDTFSKDGRTSLAFRLVFQSNEKTLDGSEVDAQMSAVYAAVAKAGWEVR